MQSLAGVATCRQLRYHRSYCLRTLRHYIILRNVTLRTLSYDILCRYGEVNGRRRYVDVYWHWRICRYGGRYAAWRAVGCGDYEH